MIKKNYLYNSLVMVFAGMFLVSAAPGLAKEDPPRDEPDPGYEEVYKLVGGSLPEIIKEDNKELVSILLKPPLGRPLREVFNPDTAIKALFGRAGAPIAPGCKQIYTPSGDIDPGECQASRGEEAGGGIYKEFRFSKNMSLGNISFFDRPKAVEIDPGKLVPVRMTDQQAYDTARKFLQNTFGLPVSEEIPAPPLANKAVNLSLPVKTLALGGVDREGGKFNVPVEKMVILQRGFNFRLGGTYGEYDWIPGPGKAMMVLDDRSLTSGGLREVVVRGWQEVKAHPDANPEFAKSRAMLSDEITRDLLNESTGRISKLNCRLVLDSIPTPSGVGLLLPAVQVHVSPVPADLSEDAQNALAMRSTAGFVRTYNLVELNETNPKGGEME